MKTIKVPINSTRFITAANVRAARQAVRTHASAVRPMPSTGALQKFFNTAKKG